mmetsp:Transcript_52623/g.132345  ORF Transcript_52623/g.132345 Transcript_52623/m.132345 type:complete len:228 (-) Transcript_52623:565-1248(-)
MGVPSSNVSMSTEECTNESTGLGKVTFGTVMKFSLKRSRLAASSVRSTCMARPFANSSTFTGMSIHSNMGMQLILLEIQYRIIMSSQIWSTTHGWRTFTATSNFGQSASSRALLASSGATRPRPQWYTLRIARDSHPDFLSVRRWRKEYGRVATTLGCSVARYTCAMLPDAIGTFSTCTNSSSISMPKAVLITSEVTSYVCSGARLFNSDSSSHISAGNRSCLVLSH